MLPTFLIIGAMRAGTTSLWRYLSAHPQVFMSDPKELHFFVEEINWGKGLAWYESHFEGAGPEALAVGEATPRYTKHPVYAGVPERIARILPEVQLVYVVRQPVERMISEYVFSVGIGIETAPIERALLENPIYLAASSYAMQIERYLAHFPRERLLVITSDVLRDRREETVRSVYEFLGVDPNFVPSDLEVELNRTADTRHLGRGGRLALGFPGASRLAAITPRWVKPAVRRLFLRRVDPPSGHISDDLRHRLEDLLRDDVDRLRRYMGEGFSGWGLLKRRSGVSR